MANKKKLSAVLRLLCGLMCLCLLLTACNDPQPTEPSTSSTQPQEAIYTITVKTVGGMAMKDVDWYVYEDAGRNDLVDYGQTKSDGVITFTAPRSDDYVLVFSNVPDGYDVQEYYPLTSTKLDVTLTSSIITGVNATDRVYELGDVIADFTVTDTDGNQLSISEILKTKEAVVLNFWYVNCGPCKSEFPYLQTAYDLYKDKLEVIAMNYKSNETAEDVASFKTENGYTFPMAKVDSAWEQAIGGKASPTTIIIDRYGVICLMETGAVVEEGIFEGAFNHFTAENYTQKLVEDIEELDTLEYPVGHKRNPMETYGAIEHFDVSVEAGKTFYTMIYKCDGLIFRVQDPDIYVVYGGQRMDPDENGVIEFKLDTASVSSAAGVEFHNETAEVKNLTVDLIVPPGSMSNPFDMTYGEVNVLLEQGNDQGVYYVFTADQTGFIHFVVTGVTEGRDYQIQIDNLTTMRSILFSDSCVEDADGNYVVVIPVNAGEQLRIACMSTPDATGAYTEMTIQALVSYSENGGTGSSEEIAYSLTFKDVEGLPMAGITATFTVNGEAVVLVSDETGLITTMLPEGSYMVQLVFPEGFTADASQYLLTPDNTEKEITVRLYEEKEITYTIHVQDHDGLPVENAVVTVNDSFGRTDAQGNVVFQLPVGSYVATIVPPEGYTAREESYSFGVRPEMTIVLVNNQSATKIPYTVTVLDGNGDPYADVVVRLHGVDGSTTMVLVSADGVASTTLIRGDYTVDLVFQQENMRYEQTGLQLTADITSTTIVVAQGVSGKPGKVNPTTSSSTFEAYYLQMGNTFVDLDPMSPNYFLFKPVQTGTYKFFTNKDGALVENWQTIDQTTPNASGVENNVFTLEVTELGKTYVVGVDAAYGISNTILTVFRVPDCVVEEYPVTPNLPTMPYRPFMPSYAELKYLDFTGMCAFVLGADGYYHLDTVDGPVVVVDLQEGRFGVSIAKLLSAGELAWYTYDEDGYPIYKMDYTAAMNAYLGVMSTQRGLYPLTDDLYTMLKTYGDYIGWWDPDSENFLFGEMEEDLLIQDSAWMFLCGYIYIDPALCPHSFTRWEMSEDYATMVRECGYCGKVETHMIGSDCCKNTAGEWEMSAEGGAYISQCTVCAAPMVHTVGVSCNDDSCGQWVLSGDGLSYRRTCAICHSQHQHTIGTDCNENTCGQWTLSEDGLSYQRTCGICHSLYQHTVGVDCGDSTCGQWTISEDGLSYQRTCAVCAAVHIHVIAVDCEEHYGQWSLSEDGLTATRSCAVCGNVQTHTVGTDCESHYDQWTLSEDGLTATRSCAVCGNVQTHTVGTDCEDHYGQWTDCEDGLSQERECAICGNKQTQSVPGTEPDVPGEGTEEPEPGEENVNEM